MVAGTAPANRLRCDPPVNIARFLASAAARHPDHALATTARAAHHVITPSPSFDPSSYLRLVAELGVTNTWLVPTQIVLLTNAAIDEVALPTLRYVIYGGAPIAPAAISRAIERFGPVFIQLYGPGESPICTRRTHREDVAGTSPCRTELSSARFATASFW